MPNAIAYKVSSLGPSLPARSGGSTSEVESGAISAASGARKPVGGGIRSRRAIEERISAALALRRKHLPEATSFRVVNAESDFLSGLIVDKYEDVLVMQTSSLGMDQRKAQIVAALHARFPQIVAPKAEDICYATSNRQAAVKAIAPRCQLVLVIGAPNSSNSLRLVEVAQRCGARAYLVQRGADVDPAWFEGVATMGLTAGASAPETLVNEVVDRIAELRAVSVEKVVTTEENMVFKLPRQLVD